MTEGFSLIEELTDRFEVLTQPDGSTRVELTVPPRFRDIVLLKLGELRVSAEEIERSDLIEE